MFSREELAGDFSPAFPASRFMGFRVHEKEIEGGGRALIVANVNHLFIHSFLCIIEVNREEIYLGKEE